MFLKTMHTVMHFPSITQDGQAFLLSLSKLNIQVLTSVCPKRDGGLLSFLKLLGTQQQPNNDGNTYNDQDGDDKFINEDNKDNLDYNDRNNNNGGQVPMFVRK